MGRRNAMKMVLPSVSWVAVMRLLKKAPSGILGIDAASKALLGCSALPDTPSLRYTDGGPRGPKAATGAALLPLIGCAARPHTDSFRIHHVVNQEALQLVLALDEADAQANAAEDIFYEPFECEQTLNCSFDMIIRDGDRLLHDVDTASANVMSACSSRLSNCTAGSCRTACSAAVAAFSGSSVDSEESHYSTASSASFQVTPRRPVSSSCCSSPVSYCHSAGIDTDSVTESCTDELDAGRSFEQAGDSTAVHCDSVQSAHNADVWHARDDDSDACAHDEGACNACNDDEDDVDVTHDDDDDGMVAETCYSKDPLLDFQASMEELVMCHQLIGQPARLHALYCRYIQLNPPTLHPTIALAFFRTLQSLQCLNAFHS